ncbi:unnamed protein product [Dibothriocephalus latus]|uniref:Uncharacterized protein n=1 Tax=Dibothriocephalus latus TaxID=60516 RepID=A0A3P7NHL0_DIBLA|nr:unnamed protein product [Dibothriocephalus latus]
MDLSSKIDMSLDDIIKSNRKNKQATGNASRKTSVRGRPGRVSALKSPLRKKSALRPNLAVTMKSRQSTTALAIFKKAQRTAAAAAKIAASAAAILSTKQSQRRPPYTGVNNTSRRGINRGGAQHSDYYYKLSQRAQSAQSRRNQEYLAQARALIQAQEEIRRQPVYVDASLPRAANFRGRRRR